MAPRADCTFMYDIRRNGVTEEDLTRLGALCRMLRFYGVPRRISLGFAHSAAAGEMGAGYLYARVGVEKSGRHSVDNAYLIIKRIRRRN